MTRLQQLRLDQFLTVDQLSEKAGVHPRTIRRMESGSGARIENLRKLAEFFDVPASSLMLPAIPPRPVEDAA